VLLKFSIPLYPPSPRGTLGDDNPPSPRGTLGEEEPLSPGGILGEVSYSTGRILGDHDPPSPEGGQRGMTTSFS